MTRAEAAAQAASSIVTLMRLAVAISSPGVRSTFYTGAIVDEEARAKLDLAAALLVLTDPTQTAPRHFSAS